MEGLEAATSAVAPAVAAPAPAAAAPVPASAPEPSPAAASSSSSSGMGTIKEAFQNTNWIEVIFGGLAVTALFSAINFYRWQKATGQALIFR